MILKCNIRKHGEIASVRTVRFWEITNGVCLSDNGILIDERDVELVKGRRCFLHPSERRRLYPCVIVNGKRKYLHHLILGDVPRNSRCDHINRNPLDNRRSNLRIVTPYANTLNRGKSKSGKSRYRGVSPYVAKRTINGKTYEYHYWRMAVRRTGQKQISKLFKNEIDAAREYDKIAPSYLGEYAVLNGI